MPPARVILAAFTGSKRSPDKVMAVPLLTKGLPEVAVKVIVREAPESVPGVTASPTVQTLVTIILDPRLVVLFAVAIVRL